MILDLICDKFVDFVGVVGHREWLVIVGDEQSTFGQVVFLHISDWI